MKLAWSVVAVAASLCVVGCKDKRSGSSPGPSATARNRGTGRLAALDHALSPAEGDAGTADLPNETHVVVGVDKGAIELFTRADVRDRSTEILGRRLDAEGRSASPVKRLANGVRGTVGWLTAVRVKHDVWIAWTVVTPERSSVSLVRADDAFGKSSGIVELFPAGPLPDGASSAGALRLAPRADESGIVAAAITSRGAVPCKDADAGEPCQRVGWTIAVVTPEGGALPLRSSTIDAGPNAGIEGVVDLGHAVFASAWAWDGGQGAVVDHELASMPGRGTTVPLDPKRIAGIPRPPYVVAFTGAELVIHAPSHRWDEKRGKCPRPSFEGGLCEQVSVAAVTQGGSTGAVDAGAPIWDAISAVDELCVEGHPVIDLVTARGTTRLEPKAGAFVPELQGWTGSALLGLDETGAVTKRTCADGKLGPPAKP